MVQVENEIVLIVLYLLEGNFYVSIVVVLQNFILCLQYQINIKSNLIYTENKLAAICDATQIPASF